MSHGFILLKTFVYTTYSSGTIIRHIYGLPAVLPNRYRAYYRELMKRDIQALFQRNLLSSVLFWSEVCDRLKYLEVSPSCQLVISIMADRTGVCYAVPINSEVLYCKESNKPYV